jgi:prophage maintenance system killer protein
MFDGNKRVGLVSMLIFLDINNYSIDYNEDALEQLTRTVAQGKTNKKEIALFLSKNMDF